MRLMSFEVNDIKIVINYHDNLYCVNTRIALKKVKLSGRYLGLAKKK